MNMHPQNAAVREDPASAHLQIQFADMEQQREAASLGMWIFLLTEIMFFGGLFLAYTVYRNAYPESWRFGSIDLSFWSGTAMTVILICSSLTMAMAVHSAAEGKRKAIVVYLILTIVLGIAFIALKGIEYHAHWVHHHFPGNNFDFASLMAEYHVSYHVAREMEMFSFLYFCLTGLHALHMIIGVGLLTYVAVKAWQGTYSANYYSTVENTGLYWHFVDIIWIWLYPLLYLIPNFKR
jgi:cytochrome c oxidase subunit 3